MSNIVVAGEYEGKTVQLLSKIEKGKWANKQVYFPAIVLKVKFGSPEKWDHIKLNKESVAAYEVITDEHRQSTSATIFRSLIGGALFGSTGAVIGAMTAKEKGIYHIAIEFKDGKQSLIAVDEKIHSEIIKHCF